MTFLSLLGYHVVFLSYYGFVILPFSVVSGYIDVMKWLWTKKNYDVATNLHAWHCLRCYGGIPGTAEVYGGKHRWFTQEYSILEEAY